MCGLDPILFEKDVFDYIKSIPTITLGWIPCSIKLPEPGEMVLIYRFEWNGANRGFSDGDYWLFENYSGKIDERDYWIVEGIVMADLVFGKKDGINYVGVIEKYNPDGSMEISTSGYSECDWKNMDSLTILKDKSKLDCEEGEAK